jgi:hypothetical protein
MVMLANEMYQFRDYLQEQGIVFCYSGYMTEQILTGIGEAVKRKLEVEDTDRKTARSVFSVFVEQVQNVIRYSAERESNDLDEESMLRYGVLTVGRQDEKFFIACGNLVEHDDIDRIRSSLEHIQSLDAEGLKALYKETLKGETPEGSKGAGVGFIDIARRATHGFEFDFSEVKDGRSYFCLKAYV